MYINNSSHYSVVYFQLLSEIQAVVLPHNTKQTHPLMGVFKTLDGTVYLLNNK